MRGAFSLQWHITDRCDQRCKHCYIWSNSEMIDTNNELDLYQCKLVVGQFIDFCKIVDCLPLITVTGGDPILSPNFWDILSYINERKIRVNLLANPYHLNPKILSEMEKCGVRSYQLSLDGMEKVHDSIRRVGSFRATLEAIKLINKTKIRSTIMSTVSLFNYHEIAQVARLCATYNVGGFGFARYNSPNMTLCKDGGEKTEINCQISPFEYRSFLAQMWKVYCELADSKTFFMLKDHLFKAYLYEEGIFHVEPNKEKIVYDGCNCGIRHLTLLPNGDIYACRRFNSPIGNIYRNKFEEAFFSENMGKYRRYDKYKGCSACELLGYCRGCHAVSAEYTGDFFNKDPQCWRLVGQNVL